MVQRQWSGHTAVGTAAFEECPGSDEVLTCPTARRKPPLPGALVQSLAQAILPSPLARRLEGLFTITLVPLPMQRGDMCGMARVPGPPGRPHPIEVRRLPAEHAAAMGAVPAIRTCIGGKRGSAVGAGPGRRRICFQGIDSTTVLTACADRQCHSLSEHGTAPNLRLAPLGTPDRPHDSRSARRSGCPAPARPQTRARGCAQRQS